MFFLCQMHHLHPRIATRQQFHMHTRCIHSKWVGQQGSLSRSQSNDPHWKQHHHRNQWFFCVAFLGEKRHRNLFKTAHVQLAWWQFGVWLFCQARKDTLIVAAPSVDEYKIPGRAHRQVDQQYSHCRILVGRSLLGHLAGHFQLAGQIHGFLWKF